ncbi:MAG TPA: TetR family transcriptional regulator [Sphingobium sp.]|uniref:TetR family transcriptional regulator n=1 Tax=Sphingobium sp. TaxID=1912891 RepID=UPI002ED4EA7F
MTIDVKRGYDEKKMAASRSRAALLEAASVLLRDGDTLEVSLNDIGRVAGISAALVAYYFGSKDGLLTALIERDASSALAAFEELLGMDISPSRKLRYHLSGLIKTYGKYPYLARLANALIRDGEAAEAKRLAAQFCIPMVDAYDKLLRQGLEAGEFRPMDTMHFYFTVIGLSQDIFASRAVLRNCFGVDDLTAQQISDYADHAYGIIMGGIRLPVDGNACQPG